MYREDRPNETNVNACYVCDSPIDLVTFFGDGIWRGGFYVEVGVCRGCQKEYEFHYADVDDELLRRVTIEE